MLSSGDDIRIYGQKLEGGGSSIRNIYAHHIYDIHTHTHTHTHTIYTHTHTHTQFVLRKGEACLRGGEFAMSGKLSGMLPCSWLITYAVGLPQPSSG